MGDSSTFEKLSGLLSNWYVQDAIVTVLAFGYQRSREQLSGDLRAEKEELERV